MAKTNNRELGFHGMVFPVGGMDVSCGIIVRRRLREDERIVKDGVKKKRPAFQQVLLSCEEGDSNSQALSGTTTSK
jgi:hypothetical protein